MLAILALTAVLAGRDALPVHVRATEPQIAAIIAAGIAASETFRRLVETLDQSDVIVYVQPKMRRPGLRGYLGHGVTASGGYRYLRIAIDVQGSPARLISLLGHELQHAVEVAGDSCARDAASIERLFARLAVRARCGVASCYETEAAQDVERIVAEEVLKPRAPLLRLADDRPRRDP